MVSYIGFKHEEYRSDFINFLDLKLFHKASIIYTQVRVIDTSNSELKRNNQNKKLSKYQADDANKGAIEISYKPTRVTHSAKFDQEIGDPDNLLKQGQMIESKSREKFVNERKEIKRTHEQDAETQGPAKKIPRRFKFTMQSKQMRRMFKMMGSGRYDVNLEEVHEQEVQQRLQEDASD